MSGAWDGTRVLRCHGGPWAGQERVWRGESLAVTGWLRGWYVATPAVEPTHLAWTTLPPRLPNREGE